MPVARFEMPDGRIARFEVPEGTSPEQAQTMMADHFKGQDGTKSAAPQSIGKTILDQGLQGATFGFADEVTDRIGAGIATLGGAGNYGDLLKEARTTTKEDLAAQLEQHPGTSLLANLGGGLLTGGAAASTKAGAAIGNSLRSGSTGARIAKGALAGASSGGLYGAGIGEDGKRLSSAGQGALLGGAVGAALPVVGAAASKLNTKTTTPSVSAVKKTSGIKYAAAEMMGGKFKPSATDKLIDEALTEIPSSQFVNDVAGDDDVIKFVKNLAQHRGRAMTLEDFEGFDKKLGKLAQRYMVSAPDMAHSFKNMQASLREIAENPDFADGPIEGLKSFREATRLWSISKKMGEVQKIVDEAQSFDVPATAIKTGFRRILRNPKLLSGYSEAERKAIKTAAETGRMESVLKTFGNRLFAMGAGLMGGPKGAAIGYSLNSAGRSGAEALKTADAAKVTRLLAERSGLVKSQQRLQIPADVLQKIMKMPPAAARAALDQLRAKP